MKVKLKSIVDGIPPNTAEKVKLLNVKVSYCFFTFNPGATSEWAEPENWQIILIHECVSGKERKQERTEGGWGKYNPHYNNLWKPLFSIFLVVIFISLL